MNRTILAAVLLAGTALAIMPAQADIVLSDATFRDLGATGFGNFPRLLTLGQNELEAGGTVAGAGGTTLFTRGGGGFPGTTVPETFCTTNGNCGGAGGGTQVQTDKSLVYSIAQIAAATNGGWLSGAAVGIGLDTNESGSNHPLTFTGLTLTLYNSAGVALGSFSGNAQTDISLALLDQQQGNGNSVFDLRLDLAQQAQYDAIINNPLNGGIANIYEGLRASFGCGSTGPAVCNTGTLNWSSTDGAESFLAFNAVPGPVVASGIPGAIAAFGMLGLNFWRRRRNGEHLKTVS